MRKFLKSRFDNFLSLLGGTFLLDRYLAAQLIPPFLFSVGLLASLGVAIGNLSDLANKVVDSKLPLILALQILLLKVPEFVAYALPVSVLLATLITYGRFSNDSEIIAFRSCGISLYRLLIPAVCLSFWVTGITFLLNEQVVPAANYQANSILAQAIQEEQSFRQTEDIFYPDYENVIQPNGKTIRTLKNLFYAEQFDGQKMKSLTILKWIKQQLTQIVISDSAIWNPLQNTWDFFNGTVYRLAPDASYSLALPFTHQQFALPKAIFDFASQGRNPYEMNITQARAYANILQLSGDKKKLRLFEVRIQQKIAFPFVCLVFGVVGAALGSLPQQMNRGKSFGLSVGIVFFYYLFNFLSGSLGLTELFSPILAAWLPNILGLAVGFWVVRQAN